MNWKRKRKSKLTPKYLTWSPGRRKWPRTDMRKTIDVCFVDQIERERENQFLISLIWDEDVKEKVEYMNLDSGEVWKQKGNSKVKKATDGGWAEGKRTGISWAPWNEYATFLSALRLTHTLEGKAELGVLNASFPNHPSSLQSSWVSKNLWLLLQT